ncbi:MAG: pseudouridine-5'-phosphate glycosidase, partial [Proteobacteria bacterium]|nr:pseudouridine-5'-phosphate glycosidase [Pseudomonadota bacterium]
MIDMIESDEVRAARAEGRALVALESTIITHGMPWPRNLDVALLVEDEVCRAGACPATIAVIGGRLH